MGGRGLLVGRLTLLALPGGPYDEHRARCDTENLFSHATQQDTLGPTAAVRRHGNQVGVLTLNDTLGMLHMLHNCFSNFCSAHGSGGEEYILRGEGTLFEARDDCLQVVLGRQHRLFPLLGVDDLLELPSAACRAWRGDDLHEMELASRYGTESRGQLERWLQGALGQRSAIQGHGNAPGRGCGEYGWVAMRIENQDRDRATACELARDTA